MLKIETYVMMHNEELLIPYIMRHYGQFSKVIFLENNSTDRSVELGLSLGAEIWKYDVPDNMDNDMMMGMKGNAWKNSTADWVICVDADEFVYHPNLICILENSKATIIHPSFHNMFSEIFPTTKGQIYDEIKMGTPDGDFWWSKMNIFKPSQIKDMNWGPGSHTARPEGNVIIDDNSGIKTLHMCFLSRQYIIEKYKRNNKRRTKTDYEKGYGIHLQWSEERINEYFDKQIPKLIKLI